MLTAVSCRSAGTAIRRYGSDCIAGIIRKITKDCDCQIRFETVLEALSGARFVASITRVGPTHRRALGGVQSRANDQLGTCTGPD